MNSILFLLIAPVLVAVFVIFMPLMGLDALIRRIRKEPQPDIPEVLGESKLDTEEMAAAYVEEAKKLVPGLTVKHDKEDGAYILSTPKLGHRPVQLDYSQGFLAFYIDDLNCYAWSTAESSNLDPFFWAAVCALKNGVVDVRTKTGRRMHWIKSDQDIWIKVRHTGSSFDSMDFYRNPPDEVMAKCREVSTNK